MADASRIQITSNFDRADNLARRWSSTIAYLTGRHSEPLKLYRWTDRNIRSAVGPDGSITLRSRTAEGMSQLGHLRFDTRFASDMHSPDRDPENARAIGTAIDDFARVCLEKAYPKSDMSTATYALDRAVRANIVQQLVREENVEKDFSKIWESGEFQRPLLQSAVNTLTARIAEETGKNVHDVNEVLLRTSPADRFEALASFLIENDIRHPTLPEGHRRQFPEDHVAALKDRLVSDLEETFREAYAANRQDREDTQAGHAVATQAVTRMFGHTTEARQRTITGVAGYSQVEKLVAAVEGQLPASGAGPGTVYWNGELHEIGLPGGARGFAGDDRSLSFDKENVLDVLAAADPSGPPSQKLVDAVHVVATQAARLCNPVPPGIAPNDPAGRAFENQLRQDFLSRQQTRLFTALDFDANTVGENARPNETATAQVVARLTATAGQKLGLEAQEVTARLLTTPRHERIERAAALSLGDPDTTVARDAIKALAADIQDVIKNAEKSGEASQAHLWVAPAGERLSAKLTRAIRKADKSLAKAGGRPTDADLPKIIATATSGQPGPGGTRPGGSAESGERGVHHSGQTTSGQGVEGRR